MSRKPRRAMQPQSRYMPQAFPMTPQAPDMPPYVMPDTYQPDIPQVPFSLPGMDQTMQTQDPTMTQALDPWMTPIPTPTFQRSPMPTDPQYAPQGLFQRLAMNTGGQNPFAQFTQMQPSNNPWQAALGGFIGGLGGTLYNRGLQGVQQKQMDYQMAATGTEAANQARASAFTEAAKQRKATIERLLQHGAERRYDIANPTPATGGATKFPLDPRIASGMRKAGVAPPMEATASEQQDLQRQYDPGNIPRAPTAGTEMDASIYQNDVHQEPDGTQWIESTDYKGKDLNPMRQWAANRGIKVVGKDDAASIKDINATIGNLQAQSELVRPKLAKSWDDVYARLANKAAAASGADADLASYMQYFPSMIRALRAEAGSRGLRIIETEVRRMIQYRPNISDPVDVWDTKMKVQNEVLGRIKSILLNSAGGQTAGAASASMPKNGPMIGRTSSGVTYTVGP